MASFFFPKKATWPLAHNLLAVDIGQFEAGLIKVLFILPSFQKMLWKRAHFRILKRKSEMKS
jgi:hypothetical protein